MKKAMRGIAAWPDLASFDGITRIRFKGSPALFQKSTGLSAMRLPRVGKKLVVEKRAVNRALAPAKHHGN
jgi:hypothetical protein